MIVLSIPSVIMLTSSIIRVLQYWCNSCQTWGIADKARFQTEYQILWESFKYLYSFCLAMDNFQLGARYKTLKLEGSNILIWVLPLPPGPVCSCHMYEFLIYVVGVGRQSCWRKSYDIYVL